MTTETKEKKQRGSGSVPKAKKSNKGTLDFFFQKKTVVRKDERKLVNTFGL